MLAPGIPSTYMKKIRQARRALARRQVGRSFARVRARAAGHALRPMLLVTDWNVYTSDQQFAPMIRHAALVAERTGLVFSFMSIDAARRLSSDQLRGQHAVGLKMSFRTPADEAEALARHVFGAARDAGARAVYFDGDDDSSVAWPGVIDAADAYVKKHCYSSPSTYERPLVGKSILTDYAHRIHSVSFAADIIPKSGGLSQAQIKKIVLGWNIAFDDKICDLAHDMPASALENPRDIDMLCRASVPSTTWTFRMRDTAVQALSTLKGSYRIHAPTDRVSQADYYGEMLRARMSVSPFGFGELCWRDFEAILCGSLLVKPEMSHVTTFPDVFIPHETYVPVAWDYSDLESCCARYLADEGARRGLADTARERLLAELTASSFVEPFRDDNAQGWCAVAVVQRCQVSDR